jgi:uncharacterized cupin superfamily protein
MKKRIDAAAIAPIIGTLYPSPFDEPCRERARKKLGDAAGLTQFGVNLLHLPPGAWSSQRHWHTAEDEFVYVLSDGDAYVLEVGTRVAGNAAYYNDIDMMAPAGGKPSAYTHRDGTPYPDIKRRGPGS